ncbi:glycosyltransferase [Streptomyces sp900116325]|uniref:glycosyltransferase n=1 Tax=Streptomyces sp. 900116325 TaxID=3154295 RepID=UPI0033D67228
MPHSTRRSCPHNARRAITSRVRRRRAPDVLALADVVISRNGTGTITELTALGKRSTWRPTAPP